MKEIVIDTNPDESYVVGRNGTHKVKQIILWTGRSGMLYMDFVGRSGKILNGEWAIDEAAAKRLIDAIKSSDW